MWFHKQIIDEDLQFMSGPDLSFFVICMVLDTSCLEYIQIPRAQWFEEVWLCYSKYYTPVSPRGNHGSKDI